MATIVLINRRKISEKTQQADREGRRVEADLGARQHREEDPGRDRTTAQRDQGEGADAGPAQKNPAVHEACMTEADAEKHQ